MTRCCITTLWLFLCATRVAASDDEFAPEQIEFFESKIRPVLVDRCYSCHAADADEVEGGLLLDSRQGLMQGGESGPAVKPGMSADSLLVEAIRYESYEMPPDGKLSDEVIADFVAWIDMGLPDPRTATDASPATSETGIDFEAGRQFWSFQLPSRHTIPSVQRTEWSRTDIDHFLLAKMEAAGLHPNAPADRRTFIRRITIDLTGLPPTPEEVETFLADDQPGAIERLVERLLASPHYGERWSQLWLDVARYAEDQAHIVGDNKELFFPNAYLYRDWVIQSLNVDLPYDQFVRLQLAADLIEPDDSTNHAALGFLGLGPKYYRRNSPAVMADEWEDRVDTVSRGLLGLTVACARCHDHKFDPISTEDYYALAGIFAGTEMFNAPLFDGVELKEDGNAKDPAKSMHVVRDAEPQDLAVMIRGDVNNPGEVVERRFLQILSHEDATPFHQGSGRLELADAIASPRNPLTARVIVNRIWAEYFGRPLVGTPSNFGMLGESPSHPELLDDLAVRFMEHQWSLKWLHREIVLSASYSQSSSISDRQSELDPENRWLSRMTRRRLSIEAWRDSILSATGELTPTIGGESIDPMSEGESRRTVYAERSRFQLNAMMSLFDAPDPNAHAAQRVETITPLQKLFVLNSPYMVLQAERFAARVSSEAGANDVNRIRRAYLIMYAREPAENEMELALKFLIESPDRDAAWIQLAQVWLASNEMLMID